MLNWNLGLTFKSLAGGWMGGGARYGPEQTLTLQPDATEGLDASIVDTLPTTNFGASTEIQSGKSGASIWRALLKFSGLDNPANIPAGSLITEATFSIYITTDNATNARTHRIFRLLRAWVEGEVTWNIYSTGNSWQTAGGFGANDCEQTDIGSRAFTAAETINEFKDFVLTPAKIQEMISGGVFANNGFLWKVDTENADNYLGSSSDEVANRPKLVVKFRAPL